MSQRVIPPALYRPASCAGRAGRSRLKWLLAILPIAATGAVTAAGPAPARALPCLGPLCVGAELDAVLDLPWLTVTPSAAESEPQAMTRRLRVVLRGDGNTLDTVLNHWPRRWFNGPGLRALASLRAVCADVGVWWRARGALPGPGGSRFVVTFEPIPSKDDHQHFRVETITWRLPAAGQADAGALRARLRQYADYPAYPSLDVPGVRWLKTATGEESVKLYAPFQDSRLLSQALRAQPACRVRSSDTPEPRAAGSGAAPEQPEQL